MVETTYKPLNKLLGEDRWGKGNYHSDKYDPGHYMAHHRHLHGCKCRGHHPYCHGGAAAGG